MESRFFGSSGWNIKESNLLVFSIFSTVYYMKFRDLHEICNPNMSTIAFKKILFQIKIQKTMSKSVIIGKG